MIPDEGLISTYAGQMGMVLGGLIVGAVTCAALTIVVLVRKAPELTTQRNLQTGKKETGLIRWWLFFASFTIGPPLVFGIVRTLIAAVDALSEAMPYWWIFAGLLGVCVLCAVIYRRFAKRLDGAYAPEPAATPEPAQPTGWSMPEGVGQWDQR